MLTPPFSLLYKYIFGILLFILIPAAESYPSKLRFNYIELVADKKINIKSHVLAVAITYLPLPAFEV